MFNFVLRRKHVSTEYVCKAEQGKPETLTRYLLHKIDPSFPYEPLERTPAEWQGMGNQRATDQILPCSSRRSLNLLSELPLVLCELLSCGGQVVRPPHIGPARWEFSQPRAG